MEYDRVQGMLSSLCIAVFANYAAQKIVEIMDGTHRSGSKMYTSYSDLTSYPCSCFFVQKGKYVTKSSCCDVSA